MVLPIWIADSFRQTGARLVESGAEFLLLIDIVKKLEISVVFRNRQLHCRAGNLETATYNEKHHWVFPLVPTASAFGKMGDCFSEKCKSADRGFTSAGDLRGHLEVRKVTRSKTQRSQWKLRGGGWVVAVVGGGR